MTPTPVPPIEEPPTDPLGQIRESRAAEAVGMVVALSCFGAFLYVLLGPPAGALGAERWKAILVILVAGFGVGMYFVYPKRTTQLVTFAASVPTLVRLGRREGDAVVVRPATLDVPAAPDPDFPEPEEPPAAAGPPSTVPP